MGKSYPYMFFVKKRYFNSGQDQDTTNIVIENVLVFSSLRFQTEMESRQVNLLWLNLLIL